MYQVCSSDDEAYNPKQFLLSLSPHMFQTKCIVHCLLLWTHTYDACASECVCSRVSARLRGLSDGHWLRAYQFAVISLAWLSSVLCQLSKGLLWACPLMRGCSHALESIQHPNRSRMAAQCLPIALD